ncbi:MAG: hypothetical protein ABIJ16_06735, partial [Bacteroidota bacterium]
MKGTGIILFLFLMIGLASNAQVSLDDLQIVNGVAYKQNEGSPYSGKLSANWDNGKPRYAGAMKEGLKEKKWTEWDRDGVMRFSGTYKAGKLEGPATYYYPHGGIREQGEYKEGRQVGEWLENDPLAKNPKIRKYETVTETYG